ncbi:MAG: hydrogenase/urease nickel incorporation protein HypA [Helicobacteraceae bacterium]|nr:hydrogenase/urease nickel incorporation protein HypA [Helicobacteraceae bacterium]
MHEYSIISDLVLLSEENASANNASKIFKITIEVGERSGVEVELLKSAFEAFKGESEFCKNAILEIKRQEVILECKNCLAKFSAKSLEYGICTFCNSNNVDIVKGRELNLLRLEME